MGTESPSDFSPRPCGLRRFSHRTRCRMVCSIASESAEIRSQNSFTCNNCIRRA